MLTKMIGMADQLYVNFWLIFGVKKEFVKRDRHQMGAWRSRTEPVKEATGW